MNFYNYVVVMHPPSSPPSSSPPPRCTEFPPPLILIVPTVGQRHDPILVGVSAERLGPVKVNGAAPGAATARLPLCLPQPPHRLPRDSGHDPQPGKVVVVLPVIVLVVVLRKVGGEHPPLLAEGADNEAQVVHEGDRTSSARREARGLVEGNVHEVIAIAAGGVVTTPT